MGLSRHTHLVPSFQQHSDLSTALSFSSSSSFSSYQSAESSHQNNLWDISEVNADKVETNTSHIFSSLRAPRFMAPPPKLHSPSSQSPSSPGAKHQLHARPALLHPSAVGVSGCYAGPSERRAQGGIRECSRLPRAWHVGFWQPPENTYFLHLPWRSQRPRGTLMTQVEKATYRALLGLSSCMPTIRFSSTPS